MTDTTVTSLVPRQRRRRGTVPAALTAPVQGTLALDFLPLLDPPDLASTAPGTAGSDWIAVPAQLRTHLEQWTRRHFQAAVEIVAGDRPATQLARWCSPAVYQDLARRAHLIALAGGHSAGQGRGADVIRPGVLSTRIQVVALDRFEASAHVRYGERSRAVAGRFEWRKNRWLNVALEFA